MQTFAQKFELRNFAGKGWLSNFGFGYSVPGSGHLALDTWLRIIGFLSLGIFRLASFASKSSGWNQLPNTAGTAAGDLIPTDLVT